MSEATLPAGPPREDSRYDRFWKHPLGLVLVAVLGMSLNLLIVLTFAVAFGNDDAERVQAMQVGEDRYALYYHRINRPYNTVTRNDRIVFDSRQANTRNCLRLKQRADGSVAVECMHAVRRETIDLPLP